MNAISASELGNIIPIPFLSLLYYIDHFFLSEVYANIYTWHIDHPNYLLCYKIVIYTLTVKK